MTFSPLLFLVAKKLSKDVIWNFRADLRFRVVISQENGKLESKEARGCYEMDAKLVTYVVESLIEKNISITAAESLTGGLFQSEITSVPGSSGIFTGGFVTYSDDVKTQLLGVPAPLIQQYGVVSYEVAVAMAQGAQKTLHADLAVSFTGAAGPAGLEGETAGTAWIGISFQGQTDAYELYRPELARNDFREACCEFAFQKISDELL